MSPPMLHERYYCGMSLKQWQNLTRGQDLHTVEVRDGSVDYSVSKVVAMAKRMLWPCGLQ
jgi:hypothetical protein